MVKVIAFVIGFHYFFIFISSKIACYTPFCYNFQKCYETFHGTKYPLLMQTKSAGVDGGRGLMPLFTFVISP